MSTETTVKVKSKRTAQLSKFVYYLALLSLVFLVFLSLPYVCGQEKSTNEAPHEKYSARANQKPTNEAPHEKYSARANEKVADANKEKVIRRGLDSTQLWTYALGSTLLISIAPFFILFFVPLDASPEREPLLKILLSFASGGLLGDAFLHLIPHALVGQSHDSYGSSHSHGHSHGGGHGHSHGSGHGHSHGGGHGHSHGGADNKVGLWVLSGILLFLFVEKIVRLLDGGGHSHSHSPKSSNEGKENVEDDSKLVEPKKDEKTEIVEPKGEIKITGYLNLVADITHNFTDGLAIGASFLAGSKVGYITTLTILLHEIPHEIGDFAILIKSGCSRRKAMFLQLLTALGAFTGTVISLMADGYDESATVWILPLTAGGFIYIATVSVLPDLLSDTKLGQSIKEIIALLVGVFMMVLIAELE